MVGFNDVTRGCRLNGIPIIKFNRPVVALVGIPYHDQLINPSSLNDGYFLLGDENGEISSIAYSP